MVLESTSFSAIIDDDLQDNPSYLIRIIKQAGISNDFSYLSLVISL